MSIGSIVSLAAGKISDILVHEAKLLYGVEDQVRSLERELRMMNAFLTDLEAMDEEVGDERSRTTITEIRKIAYDAEDVIVSYILESSFPVDKMEAFFKRYVCLCRSLPHTHQVGYEIEAINARIAETLENWKKYVGPNGGSRTDVGSGMNRGSRPRRIAYSHTKEEHVVGLDEDINKLVGWLTSDDTEIKVLSIVGMGGSGKTTLARKLYNHQSIKNHYDCVAWVSISQEWVVRQILIELLKDACRETMGKDETWSVRDLVQKLHQYLEGKKYLIVLDDVWAKQALGDIFPALPDDGRRIIITTRKREVVDFPGLKCSIHEPRRLTEEESWELFRKIALIHREQSNNSFNSSVVETLGREMLKKCEGLPLAVIALAGILSTKETFEEWERVKEAVSSRIMEEGRGTQSYGPVNEMLTLSYNDLHRDLKPCFLYMAMFSEDYEIPTGRLIRLWIAEGFITSHMLKEGEKLEDVARDYLEELIDRCVVQIASKNYRGEVKSIRIHDLIRDLCIKKAKQHDFLEIFTSQSSNADARVRELRRTVLYSDRWYLTKRDKEFDSSQLREYTGDEEVLLLPNVLWKIKSLRHLSITVYPKIKGGGWKLHTLKSLHTIKGMTGGPWMVEELPRLSPTVQKLHIFDILCKEQLEAAFRCPSIMSGAIHSLYLDWDAETEQAKVVMLESKNLQSISKCQHLRKLRLWGRITEGLSSFNQFPTSIMKLELLGTWFEEEAALATLGKLPNLTYLKLDRRSYIGTNWTVMGGQFTQLEELHLLILPNLEDWRIDAGAMSQLRKLEIYTCEKLRRLPEGLQFITTLQDISLQFMGNEFKDRVKVRGEYAHIIQHVPVVHFYP